MTGKYEKLDAYVDEVVNSRVSEATATFKKELDTEHARTQKILGDLKSAVDLAFTGLAVNGSSIPHEATNGKTTKTKVNGKGTYRGLDFHCRVAGCQKPAGPRGHFICKDHRKSLSAAAQKKAQKVWAELHQRA